jgi:hypothetical protein
MSRRKRPIHYTLGVSRIVHRWITQVEYAGCLITRCAPKRWELELDGELHLFLSAADAKKYLASRFPNNYHNQI